MTVATPGVRLVLRSYQKEAIEKTLDAESKGVRKQLGVAATGLGKTCVFLSLAEQRGGRTLILVHRDELVNQTIEKLEQIWPGVDVGIVKAKQNDVGAHVVVASVQTLCRTERLNQLNEAGTFDLCIADEAHRSIAVSWVKILDGIKAGHVDGPLLLGVTATPDRGDGKGLTKVYDEIVWEFDILWGIKNGYLCDVKGIQVKLEDLDLGGVRVRRGDYDQAEVGERMERANSPEQIVEAWRTHASDRKTVVFTPTVAIADLVAAEFRDAGFTAEMVCGETPTEERRSILEAFHRGSIQIVTNCNVLTEGVDVPSVDCILWARPTRSRGILVQGVGRGLRKHPAKLNCLVIDVVGATKDHSLVTVPSLFGIEKKFQDRIGMGGVLDALEAQEEEQLKFGKLSFEEADLFKRVRAEGISWAQVHQIGEKKRYVKSLGKKKERVQPQVILAQREMDQDVWVAGLLHPGGRKEVLIIDVPLEMAQGVAEDYVRANAMSEHLFRADAPWRKKKPSSKQVEAARKWKLTVDPLWNAGQLSEALDAHIARKMNAPRKPVPAWVKKKKGTHGRRH